MEQTELQTKLLKEAHSSKDFIQELRLRCQESLFYLTKAVLGFDALTPHLHQDIALQVQDLVSNPFLLILLPRKHFKSTIGTIGFPIWLHIQSYILRLNMKGCNVRVLLANESATNAEHFLSIIEKLWEDNELLRLLFPELIPTGKTRWNQQEMLLHRDATWPEASVETIGVGGAAQSRHYEIQIHDDLIGKEAQESETVMEKAISWFDYSESLSVGPTRYIHRVYGTRWSKRDIYQHIMDKDTKFHVYARECREAQADGSTKPIFPEWYTNEYFDDLMRKNYAHFMSQYCNNPTDPSKCDFREEWLKYYTFEHKDDRTYIRFQDDEKLVPLRELDIISAFDPSIDEKVTASRRAIVTAGSDHKSRVLLLDCYASRDTVDKVLDQIFITSAKWRPRDFLVEAVSLARLYLPLIEREGRIRHKYISCTPITVSSQRSKDSRIRDALQQVATEGRLYIQTIHRDFTREYLDFPQGMTKDILDALSMCVATLRTPDSDEDIDEYEATDEWMIKQRSEITGY